MLEKKTTTEIIDEDSYISWTKGNTHKEIQEFKNKVWVSQESLNCRLKELIKRKELSMRQALLVMGDFKDVDLNVEKE